MRPPVVCAGPWCDVVIERPRWNQRFHEAACRLAAWQEIHPRTYSAGNCPNCDAPLRLAIEARPMPEAIPTAVTNGKNGARGRSAGDRAAAASQMGEKAT